MQNAIWKILAALGVVGLGTVVVLQVQHRLPNLKKQANAAERAVTDSDDSDPPVGATSPSPEHFAAGNASPDTFFSVDDKGTPKAAGVSKDGNPFDLGEPPQATNSPNPTDAADSKTPFLFEATEPENTVKAASFQSDNASESDEMPRLGAETRLPAIDSENSVPISSADPADSDANSPILKFYSPDEKTNGVSEAPADPPSEGGVPTPVDLPEPNTQPTDNTPPATVDTPAIPETDGAEVPALVVPEPVPDVTNPTPADPFPPAGNSNPTIPKPTTPLPTPKSPFNELTPVVPEPTTPKANGRSSTSPASPGNTLVPGKVDQSGLRTAPPKSVERGIEPDAPKPIAPSPEKPATERTFIPDTPRAPPAPGNRLTPRTNPSAPGQPQSSVKGTIGGGARAAEPEPFDMDMESSSDPGTLNPSRSRPEESRGATPAAEPEPFNLDGPEISTRPLGGRPLPPLNDSPDSQKPDRDSRTSGASTSDAADPSRRISEVMRPQLTVRKQAPESATVGVAHEYRIVVSNEGDSPAYDVVVEDELSTAAEFVSSRPFAEFDKSTGVLAWNIPELAPRETREITIRIKPTGEGTLDGMATVRFKAQVRSATVIRSPRLQLELQGPAEVKVGNEVALQFRLVNRGTGDASNVVLRSVLPPGLRHPEGGDLEYELDRLRAGEAQNVDLVLIAAEPGKQIRVSAELSADGMAPTVARTDLTIVGSQLSVERLGPDKRYVGRPARFQNVITNESSFEAVGAFVEERVPDGMEVANVSSGGDYNASSRIIRWELPRIAPGKQVVLDCELVAETTGRMESVVEVIESAGFRSRAEQNTVVMVEGLHNVTADITRLDKPVAIGERFGFTVTIDNRGTAVARNVRILLQVPKEIEVVAAGTREIPGELLQGNIVRYETVVSIKPNEKRRFQVTLQGQQAIRNAVVQAQLKYDEMDKPLIVSESVTVFDDQF